MRVTLHKKGMGFSCLEKAAVYDTGPFNGCCLSCLVSTIYYYYYLFSTQYCLWPLPLPLSLSLPVTVTATATKIILTVISLLCFTVLNSVYIVYLFIFYSFDFFFRFCFAHTFLKCEYTFL
jgi:hypothetical protein